MTKRSISIMVVVALILALAGFASAGDSGTITACVKRSNGAMRMVQPWQSCNKTEDQVTWNVAGAQGPQGPQGVSGKDGSDGAAQGLKWGVSANVDSDGTYASATEWVAVDTNARLSKGQYQVVLKLGSTETPRGIISCTTVSEDVSVFCVYTGYTLSGPTVSAQNASSGSGFPVYPGPSGGSSSGGSSAPYTAKLNFTCTNIDKGDLADAPFDFICVH
jgi:hypothetical protein